MKTKITILNVLIFVAIAITTSCTKQPGACITMPSERVMMGDEVTFKNCSVDEYNSVWFFGDGTTSNVHAPTHIYTLSGEYPVTLKVYSKDGMQQDASTSYLIVDSLPKALTLSDSLIAKYSFNGNAKDESGNGHVGFVFGAILVSDRFGNANSAYSFDGIDDYIEIPNTNGAFDLTDTWSLQAWVKPSRTYTAGISNPIIWKIDRKGNSISKDNYYLSYGMSNSFSSFNVGFQNKNDFKKHNTSSGNYSPDEWYHVVGIYDGNNLLLYVDGVLVRNFPVGSIIPFTGDAPLRIGNNIISNYFSKGVFDGVIDDIRIYNRALSAEEVQKLYEE